MFKVERKTDKKNFAVKVFEVDAIFKANQHNWVLNELEILSQLNKDESDNCMKIKQIYEGKKYVYVVNELIQGGELLNWVYSHWGRITENDSLRIIYSIIKCLIYLESEGIMHRDLKPANIMLKNKDNIDELVLVDFGLAIKLTDLPLYKEKGLPGCVGSPGYIAPEMLCGLNYDYKVDIFSTACLCYILFTGVSLFIGDTPDQVLKSNKLCDFGAGLNENLKKSKLS